MTDGIFGHRPTCAHVDLGALRRNFISLKQVAGSALVMPVVKANGYGHGMVRVAQVLTEAGAHSFGVAFIEEAIELRRGGIRLPILVFGGLLQGQLQLYLEHDIEITASSVSKVLQIDEVAKALGTRARIHLKVDTGLERIGTHHYSIEPMFQEAVKATSCDVVGIYSHFADVNPDDLSLAKLQLERFLECLHKFQSLAKQPFLRHIAASGGLMALPESHLDMVRPGLASYGVYPHARMKTVVHLEPVLSLSSRVVFFKVVKEGAGVSYGHKWHAPEDTRVITIPVGYGDGYTRQLSNKAPVIVGGKRRQVVGAICMDQLMVNLGPEGEAYNGDEVVLIGTQGEERISVEELAQLIDTAPHEVLVSLNQRIPRVYRG